MGILKFVNDVSTGASNKVKEVGDSSNLKKKINYESDRIQEIFTEIGEKFYKDQDGDHSELKKLCEDIDKRYQRIDNMKVEAGAIKGYRICPKCKSKFQDNLEFCGHCGTKLTVFSE